MIEIPLATSVVIGTDYICSCESNYNTIVVIHDGPSIIKFRHYKISTITINKYIHEHIPKF
jgi:hypothetical protein